MADEFEIARRSIGTGTSVFDFADFHINPNELDDMIETHGIGAELRRAVQCPCIRIETRWARANCPHCKGLTYVYPETLREPVVVLLTNRMPLRKDHTVGQLVHSEAQVIFPRPFIPGDGDIVVPDCEFHIVQEVLFRDSKQIDDRVLRERVENLDERAEHVEVERERLVYDDIRKIEAVFWITPRPGGSNEKLIAAQEGVDFTRKDDRILWRNGRGPEPGQPFTVRYQANAAYMLSRAEPVFRAEDGVAFPYRAKTTRLDQWAKEDLL